VASRPASRPRRYQAYVPDRLGGVSMDGRLLTVLLLLVVPAALLGVTVLEFSSNPVAVLALIAVMIAGGFYLLTYSESFA
jgi:hypothetical protein